MIKYDEIDSIDFGFWGSNDIKKYSVVEVKESKLSGENSVNDDRMGVIQNYSKCVTCGCDNKTCPGHFGHIELNIPICHPKHYDTILEFLTLFCHNTDCNKLLIDKNELDLLGLSKYKSKKFKMIIETIKKLKKICKNCFSIQPTYKYYENKYYKCDIDKKQQSNPQISSSEIYKIFSKITNEDLNLIEFPTYNHPINCILTVFPVVPKTVRPYVETGNAISDDDLTTKYIEIVKFNNKLAQKNIKENERNELINKLEFHIQTLVDNKAGKSRPINGRPYKCFSERLNSKTGRFRTNLTGKRGDFTARTVLGTQPYLRADEVEVPNFISEKLTFPETVFDRNIKHLQHLVDIGKANTVIRKEVDEKGNVKENRYDLKFHFRKRFVYKSRGFDLQAGDIIIRNNKKIEYNKLKNGITLLPTDVVYRNNKLLKSLKLSEIINIDFEPSDLILRECKPHIDDKCIVFDNTKITQNHNMITPNHVGANPNSRIGKVVSVFEYLRLKNKSTDNLKSKKYTPSYFIDNNMFCPIIVNDNVWPFGTKWINDKLDRSTYIVDIEFDKIVINIRSLQTNKFIISPDNINRINPKELFYTYKTGDRLFRGLTKEKLNEFVSRKPLSGLHGLEEFSPSQNEYKKYELPEFECKRNCTFEVKIGDVVECQLKDGDMVILGRQPTLHVGSMIARKIKTVKENNGLNNNMNSKTIRINLSLTKSMNADMDGDELNIYAPQSYSAKAELIHIASTSAMIKSTQNGCLMQTLCQDALVFGYYYTLKNIILSEADFNDSCMYIEKWEYISPDYDTTDFITNVLFKHEHITKVLKWKYPNGYETNVGESNGYEQIRNKYHCRNIFSMLLPNDFEYKNGDLVITRGVLLNAGVFNKTILGNGFSSILHKLEKDYGAEVCINFITNFQILSAVLLTNVGFSIGIDDCYLDTNVIEEITKTIETGYIECQIVANTEPDEMFREIKTSNTINNVFKKCEDIGCKNIGDNNALKSMIKSGAKGTFQNFTQISCCVGQQCIEGKRVPHTYGGRTLPHYPFENLTDKDLYESRGFVKNSFLKGMTPQEFFFQSCGGREGCIDTAIKTAKSGYIQRKLTKKMEDVKISYSHNFVVNANEEIVQMTYGEGYDPAKAVTNNGQQFFTCVNSIVDNINAEYEFENNL